MTLKGYSTDEEDGRRLWNAVEKRLSNQPAAIVRDAQARFGQPYQTQPRLGQGAFRVLVTDSYERRCAVTRERTLPALDAAHIIPYAKGGSHEASNGILFRRDIHSLFDLGYVTVTPDLHFEVSRRLREDYENGRDYYALDGQEVAIPVLNSRRPNPAALAWHNSERFLH